MQHNIVWVELPKVTRGYWSSSWLQRVINNRADLHNSQEQKESKNKVTASRANNQQCVLVIVDTASLWVEMSPRQVHVAVTSALLLACVYLSVGVLIPTRRLATCVTVPPANLQTITRRTGSEAINAKVIVDDYFREAYDNKHLNISAICSTLVPCIVLPCPQDVPGCNSLVNVSTNLNYLRHMYTHVLGLIYQNSINEPQLEQLDLLEMIFYRLSNQMQWYLQANNLSSGDDKCVVHDEIDGTAKALQQAFTYTEIAHAILCHLRDMARNTVREVGIENVCLRPYLFCSSVTHLHCPT